MGEFDDDDYTNVPVRIPRSYKRFFKGFIETMQQVPGLLWILSLLGACFGLFWVLGIVIRKLGI